jgi:hypothetical protein
LLGEINSGIAGFQNLFGRIREGPDLSHRRRHRSRCPWRSPRCPGSARPSQCVSGPKASSSNNPRRQHVVVVVAAAVLLRLVGTRKKEVLFRLFRVLRRHGKCNQMRRRKIFSLISWQQRSAAQQYGSSVEFNDD